MQINLSLDASVSNAPSNFMSLLNQGVQFLEQTFANPITITIQVGWGEIDGTPLPSNDAGEAGPLNGDLYTYSQVRAALAANVSSEADALSVANLPSTDPTRNSSFFVGEAEEKALGLVSPTAGGIDGVAGFQGTIGVGVVIHELTHAMGRIDILGQSVPQADVGLFGLGRSAEFSPLDLFRYVGNGAMRPTSASGYFSFDGGKTQINTYDPTDTADWNNTTPDAFNSIFFGPNAPDPVTTGDLEEMNVLGYALANPTISGQLLTLTSIPETVLGFPGDTIVGSSGTAVINATSGAQSITGGSGAMTVFGGNGDTVVAGSGTAYIDGSSGGVSIFVGTGGTDTIIGTVGNTGTKAADTISGGAAAVQIQGLGKRDIVSFGTESGSSTVNGTAGGAVINLGSGAATVYAGAGDTITLGSVSQYVDGTAGGATIGVGSAGTDTLVGALAPAAGAGADTLVGGAAAVQVQGLGKGDVVNFVGQTGNATINATAGTNTVTLGNGGATIYGGAGDTIALGSGAQYVDGTLGGSKIAVGAASGSDTVIGALARAAGNGGDTLTGGGAPVQVQGLGKGDVVNFAAQTGNALVNATAGNIAVTLGSGGASVYAGAGDTISLGAVSQYVDARGGGATAPGGVGALIALGSGGTDNIIGSTVAGAPGITVNGGAAALNYNAAAGNDLINLAGAAGSAVVNGFGFDSGPVNDTIIAGNGGDSVWGGQGDRIGVGNGASGTDLFTHASTIAGASIGFGSNDSVVAATYGSTAGAVTVNGGLAGASSAKVTVSGFAETGGTPSDFVFYQGESAATNTAIVATSSQVLVNGLASTMMVLPDGTAMTLVGVPKADFNPTFFKA